MPERQGTSLAAFFRRIFIAQGFLWDWLAAFSLIRFNRAFLKHLPHNERFFMDRDPALSYPMEDCYLPHDAVWAYVFFLTPTMLLLGQAPALWSASYTFRRAFLDFHAGYLSLTEAYAMAATFKHLLERSGKLRPDWLARLATGNAKFIEDGRQSYPSGHALYPAMVSTLLTLFCMGRAKVLSKSGPGQFPLCLLCMVPTVVALVLALDRVACYDHDYVDTVAGAMVGTVCGGMGYALNFHSVTHPQLCGRCKEREEGVRVGEEREGGEEEALLGGGVNSDAG